MSSRFFFVSEIDQDKYLSDFNKGYLIAHYKPKILEKTLPAIQPTNDTKTFGFLVSISTMKHAKVVMKFLMFAAFMGNATGAKAQDVHFAQLPEMNIWYNPALKTNKTPQANIIFHNVNYPAIISYSSKAATIELPLIGKDKDVDDVIPYANVSAGINTDNSNDRFMAMSTAMLSFSYALPLNDDDTYLSASFQGNYSFSRVGLGTSNHLPDQFDKFGALASAIAADPFQSGYSYGYFTAGVGAAFFHSGQDKQWYLAGSIRHFNHPYTEWTHSVRLPQNNGIQVGYTSSVSGKDVIIAYANFTWQSGSHDHLIGAAYTRTLDDSATNKITCGIGFRFADALIPNLNIKLGRNQFSCYYEINIPGAANGIYRRSAYTVSYRLNW